MTSLLFAAVGIAAAGGLYALDRVASAAVRPVPRPPARGVPDSGLEHEDLVIDGLPHPLAAWLVRAAPAETSGPESPLFVLAHGWGACCGTVLLLAEPLARSGHDVLLFDMRGHGRNLPVRYVTVRHLRDDVSSVVRWAVARFPRRPIILVGHSFGGAAGVLAAAEGAPVAGLVLIAAPADVVQITAEYLTAKGMPGALIAMLLRPFWWWRLGGTFVPHSPERRLRELDLPVLVIQPEHDQRVHGLHAERLAAAAGVEVRIVRDREHTDVLGAEETLQLVRGFAEALLTARQRS